MEGKQVPEQSRLERFEESVLPHLDAANNLARWLTRDDGDAEDLVQEAYLRAFRFFDGFRGGDSRAWLLKIVRNTFYTTLKQRARQPNGFIDEGVDDPECDRCDPETIALANIDRQLLREAMDELPVEYREVMVLRELEGFAYKEIAAIAGVPIGTVMSRLARARAQLRRRLTVRAEREARHEL
jgi:RNA polymerase sigma-70 factor (ECF subfamily)